jgi:phenylacetate-CoA ligase
MPLLRYETGDVIEYSAQPGACECGRAMPRVLRIEGRLDDGVLLPDGRLITTLFLVIDKAAGIRRGQIVQDRPDHLLVRIAPAEDWSAEREQMLLRDLRLFVGSLMGITVHCEPEGALRPAPGRKWRTIISQVTAAKQEA